MAQFYRNLLIGLLASAVSAFEVVEIKPSFGAEVRGLDLASISDEDFNELSKYLLSYKVLVLKDQSSLSVEEQRQFTRRFGPLHSHLEATSHHPDYPDVNVISNIKNTTGGVTGLYGDHVENFHTDLSWSHLPTKVTLLKSDILPVTGGDTHFADSTSAYDSLTSNFKAQIHGLKGYYTYLKFRDEVPGIVGADWEYVKRGQEHPLIITHPLTGAKCIYANAAHTARVVDKTELESQEILQILFDAVAQPQYRYIHKWSSGDILLWDNRAMQHKATPAPDSPRRLVRTTVLNDDIPREEIDDLPSFSVLRATRSILKSSLESEL